MFVKKNLLKKGLKFSFDERDVTLGLISLPIARTCHSRVGEQQTFFLPKPRYAPVAF